MMVHQRLVTIQPLLTTQPPTTTQPQLLIQHYERRPILSATVHPDIKRTLVEISERTGMSVSQVTDEVLYAGLIEMQEL